MTVRRGGWVLGVDSGGSGLRAALADAADPGRLETAESHEPVRTGSGGIDAQHLLDQLLPMARALLERTGGGSLSAVAIGAAGMATLGGALRAELPAALDRSLGVRRLALAADAVTAYAGALGQRPGAVVAAGDRHDRDGHGSSGVAPGGRLGPSAGRLRGRGVDRPGRSGGALRAHDGRRGGSSALLTRMESVFGPAQELPGQLYPRSDRPAVLASFAPEVAECAAAGDEVSAGILATAAQHIAEAAAAACPPVPEDPQGSQVALTGGLLKLGEPLLTPLRAELAGQLPHARLVSAAGDPLSGAVLLAAALATDSLLLPRHPTLLHAPTEPHR